MITKRAAKAPLEVVIAALMTGHSKVEVFVEPSEFAGIHGEPGTVMEFQRTVTFKVTGLSL